MLKYGLAIRKSTGEVLRIISPAEKNRFEFMVCESLVSGGIIITGKPETFLLIN